MTAKASRKMATCMAPSISLSSPRSAIMDDRDGAKIVPSYLAETLFSTEERKLTGKWSEKAIGTV